MMTSRQSGFTLIEVMVALAIFAVVSAALIRNAALSAYQTSQLQDRTVAAWVAENRMTELRTGVRNPADFPRPGSRRDSVTIADREFEVMTDFIATENRDMHRVEISVFTEYDPDVPLITLAGFIGRY